MGPGVAQVLASHLADCGVRVAYGIPGGVLLPVIDALAEAGIEFVLVRHEGSAGFMADVTWQLTGAPGLCLGTLGPGMTNLVSPMAGAMLERSRVLALTAQCRSEIHGIYTHQILDQVRLMAPVVGWGGILDAQAPHEAIQGALQALTQGPPGPVHLDVPGDLWETEVADVCVPAAAARQLPAVHDLDSAADALRAASRPVMAVGLADLSDEAAQAVRALSADCQVPVMTTYRAKGMIDESDDWSLGAFGLSGVVDRHFQALLEEADLLIAVGLDPVELRPQWLPGWPETLPMMVIDPHGQPDIHHPATWDLRGDIPAVLAALQVRVDATQSAWTRAQVAAHRAAVDAPFDDGPDGPAATIRAVQRGAGEGAIVSLDVGAHRITASHVWQAKRPRELLQSNGFSTMGTGLPGAIAAKLCLPERTAVALTGDAGLWMCLGELGVAQDQKMDLVVVYLADESLTLIELKQRRIPLAQRGVRFSNPDVVSLASAFGGTGRSVRGEAAVEAAVAEAVAAGGLWVIEAVIDPSSYDAQL